MQREVFPKRRPKYLKPDSAAYANYHQHSDGQGGFFFYRTMGLQVRVRVRAGVRVRVRVRVRVGVRAGVRVRVRAFFYRTMGLQVGGKLGLEPGLGKLLGK